jgi:hypothetical protein
MAQQKPFVLHVDDMPDELGSWRSEVAEQGVLELIVRRPSEVTDHELRQANLVLVDFKLTEWPERDNGLPLALRPVNGLALLSVLQEAALEIDPAKSRAFALYTSVLGDVARGLPQQPHLVARAHNLEWVFEKNSPRATVEAIARRVAELARAVDALPQKWPSTSEAAESTIRDWLGISLDATWFDAAWEGVVQCQPPLHSFAEHTLGIGVVRWLLQKVLPYPTFLLDEAHFAARLRVPLASFRSAVNESEFTSLFGDSEYKGQLGTIQGRRWWRAGLEAAIFNITQSAPGSLAALRAGLNSAVPSLKVVEKGRLFVVLDNEFRPSEALASESEGVSEVRPDDWPPFADEAWARNSDIAEWPGLKAVKV